MNKKSMVQAISAIIFTLALITNFACSDDSSDDGDKTAPTVVSVIPDDGSLLYGTEAVVIVFSEAMGTASQVIAGDMADAEAAGVWSTTTVANDTLTISPTSSWANGNGQELIVDATDAAGNKVETIDLTYDIDAVVPTVIDKDPVSTLAGFSLILITFSESIDTTTLEVSDTMTTTGSPTTAWSTENFVNDKLTITPPAVVGWQEIGSITIKCDDLAGNHFEATYEYDKI